MTPAVKRTIGAVGLLLFGCLMAGLYGMLHNQISYTVSPEYFTRFKFRQFGIPPAVGNRTGAAMVGWQASWWMGIIIGLFVIPAGMMIRGDRRWLLVTLKAFAMVTLTALVTGLTALLISFVLIRSPQDSALIIRGVAIEDSVNFLRAGTMHNFSYLGGLLGIFTGLFVIYRDFVDEAKG